MSDLNQCTFTGRLGADPEIKSFQNGGRICNLRLAVGEQWKDKQSGERKERTEWVSVTINSDGLIGVAERFLRKGSRVLIQGRQQTRKWQDQSGADRYSVECVVTNFDGKLIMLDGKPAGQEERGERKKSYDEPASGTGGGGRASRESSQWQGDGNNSYDDLSDDIPFVSNRSIW